MARKRHDMSPLSAIEAVAPASWLDPTLQQAERRLLAGGRKDWGKGCSVCLGGEGGKAESSRYCSCQGRGARRER